jgi:hypothetical protein
MVKPGIVHDIANVLVRLIAMLVIYIVIFGPQPF